MTIGKKTENEKQVISTACPLDCWDACSILAAVEDGVIKSLAGNPANPVTGKALCSKGLAHMARQAHPERLRRPLVRDAAGEGFREVTWDEALDLVAKRLDQIRREGPATAVLHCAHAGSVGLLKKLEARFFSAYGGVTTSVGSLCEGAGHQAQNYDFGAAMSHEISDVVNARVVVIWGRNPAETGIHAMPFLRQAKERGAEIVVIDPRGSATSAALSAQLVTPRPGTDGALALSIAHVLIEENLVDAEFIRRHVKGYPAFKDAVKPWTPEAAEAETGVSAEVVRSLARLYGSAKPACLLVGYGVQRYTNGGETIRAIDALAAITGNIGISGGGVNYNNDRMSGYLDSEVLSGQSLRVHHRTYPRPMMADFILSADHPKIKAIFTTKANPVTQFMDTGKMLKAFESVDFKVTIDQFMTDTAQVSDVVLPCAHFLESTDVILPPAVHSYLTYCSPVVEADPWVPSEHWIFTQLAKRLGLEAFPAQSEEAWLELALKPLSEALGYSVDVLKKGPVPVHEKDSEVDNGLVAWSELTFKTPSRRIELWSNRAGMDGFDPVAVYRPVGKRPSPEEPYYLLTPHIKESLHSQHFLDLFGQALPVAYLGLSAAKGLGVADGDKIKVFNSTGQLICTAKVEADQSPELVLIHEGWWLQKGGGVNQLVAERAAGMGLHAAYYEVNCNVTKCNG
ncbi:molybdopterin-containing oxidoreductase family protein [Acidaminobacter sp.]|uniref:molybdopterin-containing oxidoreductase family protein n=1 Tax=Acidaminobacter sp. TaxID=1872102 RepID=UPI00255D47B9|nr:molybdopterin-dependent oxidoreductase [Acidaminobacter sp.]MDK9710698.1 molybdopterin-dependent oxidoreductase [Acidaminobacter sp.]